MSGSNGTTLTFVGFETSTRLYVPTGVSFVGFETATRLPMFEAIGFVAYEVATVLDPGGLGPGDGGGTTPPAPTVFQPIANVIMIG